MTQRRDDSAAVPQSNGSAAPVPKLEFGNEINGSSGDPSPAASDFAAARSLKRELLAELRAGWEEGHPVRAEDLLPRWPGNAQADPDVASLLFEEYCQRRQQGEQPAAEEYDRRFPAQKKSLVSLSQQQALLRSIGGANAGSGLLLALPEVGDELLGFRLYGELGRGSFARVFLAEQTALAGRSVVVKVSAIEGDEPQTLAQLQHTHIVPIYSAHEDTHAGLRVVCMPYFGGASLSRIMQALWAGTDQPAHGSQLVQALLLVSTQHSALSTQHSALGPEQAGAGSWGAMPTASGADVSYRVLPAVGMPPTAADGSILTLLGSSTYVRASIWIVARLAEALQHAHQRGVLHRDIKPSNVLLGADGQPMLLDFNLAQHSCGDRAQAVATLGGTVAYMAPEHLRALAARDPALVRQVDRRADIYGLGMVLYEMLTGRRPFDQSASYSPIPALIEAMALERGRNVPSLRERRPDVPWSLESITRKCLAPDPAQRYQQAEHLAEDLRCFLEDRPLKHAAELSWAERIGKWVRRHPRLAPVGSVALAATLLLAIGFTILVATQSQLQASRNRTYQAEGAEAQVQKQDFLRGVERARCLVNATSELQEYLPEALAVCERTLAYYGVLDRDDWQAHPAWQRLEPEEQQLLLEETRELLLLMARARVLAAPAQADPDLPHTLAAALLPLTANCSSGPISQLATWSAGQSVWGPKAESLRRGITSALQQALALLDRADTIGGLESSRALWEDRAFYLALLGDAEGARAAQKKAGGTPPSSARDHYLMATAYALKQHYAEAVREADEALRLNPRDYWSCYERGLCNVQLNEPILAIGDFSNCLGLWPEFAWGYFHRGRVLHQLGKDREAADDYTAALERDPAFVLAYVNRGLVHLDLHQFLQALADMDAALARGRDDVLVHTGRGIALENLKRFEQADTAFQRARALGPNNQAILLYGFAVYQRLPDEAQTAFAKVIEREPRNLRALYGYAMLLAKRTRHSDEAVRYFTRAIEADPTFVPAHRGRANVLAHQGRWEEACQEIDWCVKMDPAGATLYAAACVYALLAEKCPERTTRDWAAKRALGYLGEAFDQDYGLDIASDDPDLTGIRQEPGFRLLLQRAHKPKNEV